MTIYYNTIKLTLLLGLFLGVSCKSNDMESNSTKLGQRAEIRAAIGNSVEVKANPRSDDGISYLKFETGDKIGFYSVGGLIATNTELAYVSNSFVSDDLQWMDADAKNIFAYYPYTVGDQTNIWRVANGSVPAGFDDMLIAKNSNVAQGTLVQMDFQHQFAMLIIQRGAGFQTQSDKTITVNLKDPVSKTATITNQSIELKKDAAGEKMLLAYNGPQYKNVDSWYVIVPIGKFSDGSRVEVESVTLVNDKGDLMTIPYSRKDLVSNTKYRVTVQLRNDVAVIEPEEIIRWTDEDVAIEVLPGISTEDDFGRWLAAYNDNMSDVLGDYGSYDAVDHKWTFRLLNDIKIQKWNQALQNSVVIRTFNDIFDGQGHTISGIKLIGTVVNSGFFGTITTGGTVQNLKLEDINLQGGDNVGAIAGTNAGTILNCQVKGFSVVVGNDNVGGLVGNNTNTNVDAISKCTSSAMVSGTTTIGLLVGNGTPADQTNISTGVVVTK